MLIKSIIIIIILYLLKWVLSTDYSIEEFIKQPCMNEIRERSIFIHVDVPGHEDNAETLNEG